MLLFEQLGITLIRNSILVLLGKLYYGYGSMCMLRSYYTCSAGVNGLQTRQILHAPHVVPRFKMSATCMYKDLKVLLMITFRLQSMQDTTVAIVR